VPGLDNPVEMSTRGFASHYIVNGVSGVLSRMQAAEVGNVRIATNVSLMGATGIVQFIITNNGDSDQTISLGLSSEIFLNRDRRATFSRLRNSTGSGIETGFRITNGLVHFQIFTKSYPMVVDVDTFWYGLGTNLDQSLWLQTPEEDSVYDDSGIAISWRDRVVAAHKRLNLAVVMTWGTAARPPSGGSVSMPVQDEEIDWNTTLVVSGTLEDYNEDDGDYVVLVVDGDLNTAIRIPVDSSGNFAIPFNPSSLGLMSGSHQFQVYRVDSTGYINPVGDPIEQKIIAPTLPMTETPTASRSPTPTPTATASWGEIIDIPWFENDPLDNAESGVSPITVGKVVVGVGIPIGIILVAAFGFLLARYRRAVRDDMNQRLRSSSASEAGSTGLGA
jgi:hypothetical protein